MGSPFPYPTKTIPDLPAAAPVVGGEVVWINQAGADVRTTLNDIVALTPGPSNFALASVGPNPPPAPQDGELWFDSVSTQMFVWYVDPTSSQWVAANNTQVEAGLPEAPADGGIYARQGSTETWQSISGTVHPLTVDAGVY
jgi:hypothetical protein